MHTGEYGIIDEDDGQPFYDAWMDWQDEDDNEREEGAEDDFYDGLDPPYFTSGKEVQSFDEFRMIKGFITMPMTLGTVGFSLISLEMKLKP